MAFTTTWDEPLRPFIETRINRPSRVGVRATATDPFPTSHETCDNPPYAQMHRDR